MKKILFGILILVASLFFSTGSVFASHPPDQTASCSGCPGTVRIAPCTAPPDHHVVGWEKPGCRNGVCEVVKQCAGDPDDGGGGPPKCDGNEQDQGTCTARGGQWVPGESVSNGCYGGQACASSSWPWCRGRSHKSCDNESQCSWGSQTCQKCLCKVVTPTKPPTPPVEFKCLYLITQPAIVTVEHGATIRLANSVTGSTGTWRSDWSITSDGPHTGTVTPYRYNTADWKVPSILRIGQSWTITVAVTDNVRGKGTQTCSKTLYFGDIVTPPPKKSTSFYQALGGNVTAVDDITDVNLPDGKELIGNSLGNLAAQAGVAIANLVSWPADAKLSPTNRKLETYSFSGERPTYQTLLNRVLLKSGYSKLSDLPCSPSGRAPSLGASYLFWCYTDNASLNSLLQESAGYHDGTKINVFVPYSANGASQTGTRNLSFSNTLTKPTILFVDAGETGALVVNKDFKTSASNPSSLFMAVVDGRVKVERVVKQMDGVYLFNRRFNDTEGGEGDTLSGLGSLLGVGGRGLTNGFERTVNLEGAPAEKWTFDGRYLFVFREVLAGRTFHWEELSPEVD